MLALMSNFSPTYQFKCIIVNGKGCGISQSISYYTDPDSNVPCSVFLDHENWQKHLEMHPLPIGKISQILKLKT